jgi:hypothetical protein
LSEAYLSLLDSFFVAEADDFLLREDFRLELFLDRFERDTLV